jgi:general secretion pathway protein G
MSEAMNEEMGRMNEITIEDDGLARPAETPTESESYHTWPALFKYRAGRRGGFTLIELLIVLVVVLLLAGLLLGAVLVVRGRVRVAQQVAELVQLDLALNNFKQKYGIFPPSRIRLREWQQGLTDIVPTQGTPYLQDDPFDQHSVAYLRRIWPSIKLWIKTTTGGTDVETPGPGSIGQWFQDNSASPSIVSRVYELEGDECLVFFLGGICEKTGTDKYILHGFTDDASNPSRIPIGTIPRTQKRIQPMYPFDVGRLYQRASFGTDLIQPRTATDSPGEFFVGDFFSVAPNLPQNAPGQLPSYKIAGADQSRPLPIAYFSAYEGRGYRPDDVNIPPAASAVTTDHAQVFQLTWPQVTVAPSTRPSPISLGPNPFSRNPANPAVRTPPNQGRIQPYNPQTFQLILPGPDNEFGAGGAQVDYVAPNNTNWLSNEDNITNFSGGAAMGDFVNQQTQK